MSSPLNVNMIYLIYAWPNELEKRECAIRSLGSKDFQVIHTIRASILQHENTSTYKGMDGKIAIAQN